MSLNEVARKKDFEKQFTENFGNNFSKSSTRFELFITMKLRPNSRIEVINLCFHCCQHKIVERFAFGFLLQ